MLATPAAAPPRGDAWRHEVKWDGIRAIVTVRDGAVTIATRSGADCTARFPEILGSHLADFDDLVLDGEIVALVDDVPDFRTVMHRLAPGGGRSRMSATSAEEASRMARTPVRFMVFDVLRAAGHDVVGMPWSSRRALLVGAGLSDPGVIEVPDAYDDGQALFAATREQGMEGIVSKRVDAPYRPGVRSDDWVKSVHRQADTFVVGGWRPVAGTQAHVGAVLVGEVTDGQLRYRGRVGTGFSASSGRALLEWLSPTTRCPFTADELPPEDMAGTHWVRPDVTVDVTHLGRSAGGRLRQPAYKGLRLDIGTPRG